MKKLLLYGLSATMLLFGASGAGSARIDLSPGKGPNSPYDQASDRIASPDATANYEFLLDIAQPAGNKSLITQHELQVHLVPNGIGTGIATYADLQSSGTKLRDLDRLVDSRVNYDSNLWKGSGQDIDVAFMLPTSLFSGYSLADHVNSYTQYGTLGHLGFPPQADSGEYAIRKRGTPAAEPATMVLLGCGLIGLAGFGRKKFIK